MRKEIRDIVEKIKANRSQTRSTPFDLANLPNGYEYVLSAQERTDLARLEQTQQALIASLQAALTTAWVHVGTSTSVEIEWANPKADIVIELSLVGNLGAVFRYGEVSAEMLAYIDNCLTANHLLKLSNEEIIQLEREAIYHPVF